MTVLVLRQLSVRLDSFGLGAGHQTDRATVRNLELAVVTASSKEWAGAGDHDNECSGL